MAEIDSLSISIAVSARKANDSINSIITSLENLSNALNIDTSKLANIGKSINLSGISNQAKAISESMGSMGAKVAQSMRPAQEQTGKVVKSLEQITAQYADLGKDFELKGSTAFIQKQIDNLANSLSKVNLKKQELEASGEIGSKTYEYAIRDAIKYTNQIESLTKQLSSLKSEQTQTAYIKIADLDNAEFDKWLETLPSIKTQSEEAAKSIENIGESTKATIQGFTGAWSGINLSSDLEKINQLGAKLSQLEVPEIREENLDKLYIALDKTEAKLEELRIKLSNGIIMGEITDNIDDSGYIRLQKQIALTEKEAEALRNKILQVSESNDKAGNSAKNLGNSLAKVKNNANSSANSISKLGRNVKSLTRQILSAVGIIGGLSAIIKGIKDSIPNFTDYIESYNYFNVAFEKIGSEWSQDFGKYGYDNAESYAESFTKRMNETLGKLSGVQVNIDTGLLEETGLKNLGLNIQQITQYASQLASVTNSIGQTGEVSLAAASSFTKLAGDISSLFNVDFQDVANNLQSGLLGQSRALYKYGIDITNATLGTYAYNLGLEKSVSEMTQAEKMQLRMLAILDQSKVSWGDLANTIQSPSNMLRQFQNNLKEVSMVFGQLFIPVLQKVMPVINGITIAIKRLLVSFAQILGISIDFDSFGQGYADLGDGADGLSDALDGVAASAKKAKAGLRAFDELKVINMPDTSGIGAGAGVGGAIDLTDEILAATAEYEKAWNDAFAKMENTAQEWADKIEKILEPVRKIFEDFAVGDFFQAGKDTSALVTSIINFFADAIDRVDWYQIGKNIGDYIAGIDWTSILKSVGNLIWQAIKASIELWAGSFSAAPIETGIISAVAILKFTKAGELVKNKLKTAIFNSSLISGFSDAWASLGGWGGILTTDLSTIFGAGTAAEIGVTIGTGILGGLAGALAGGVIGKLLDNYVLGPIISFFDEDLGSYYKNFKWFGEGGFFDTIITTDWKISLKALDEMGTDIRNNKFIQFLTGDVSGLLGKKHKTWDETKAEVLGAITWIKEEVPKIWNAFIEKIDTISDWFNNSVKPWFTKEKWIELGANMGAGLQSKAEEFFTWWNDSGNEWFNNSVKPVFSVKKWQDLGEIMGKSLSQKWNDFTSWWDSSGAKKWFAISVSPIFAAKNWDFSGITEGLSAAWENAVSAIKGIWNKFAEWLNSRLDFSWDSVSILGKEVIPSGQLSLGKIPTFKAGGFPEDGLFFANHTELVGRFANGKTAVANNDQISQGFAEAIYPAIYNAVKSAMVNSDTSNGNISVQINLDGEPIYKDIIKRTKERNGTFGGRLVLADEIY